MSDHYHNKDNDGSVPSSTLTLDHVAVDDEDTNSSSCRYYDTNVHNNHSGTSHNMKHRIKPDPPMTSSLSTTSTKQVSSSDGTSTTTSSGRTMDDIDSTPRRHDMTNVTNDSIITTTLPHNETMNANHAAPSLTHPIVPPPSSARYTLPNGQPIDAKNTLYSFDHNHHDTNIRNTTGATIHLHPPPSRFGPYDVDDDVIVDSNSTTGANINPGITVENSIVKQEPVLPTGEMITAKNTLRSFDDDDNRYVSNPQNMIRHHLYQYDAPIIQHHPPPSAIGMPIINHHRNNIGDHGTVIADVLGVVPMEHHNNHMGIPLQHQQQNNNVINGSNSSINPSPTSDPTILSTTTSTIPLWLRKRSFRSCVIILLLLLLIGIISVVVSINATNRSNTNTTTTTSSNDNSTNTIFTTPSNSPINVPSVVPTISHPTTNSPTTIYNKEQIVTEFINNISLSNEPITLLGTSTESKALQWIVNDDPLVQDTLSSTLLTSLQSSLNNTLTFRIQQRFVLLLFWFQRDIVKNQGWTNTSGWLTDSNECNWYGIRCYDSFNIGPSKNYSYVIQSIDFYEDKTRESNLFVGSIPASIGLLHYIQIIDFSLNNFTSTIPESIGQLTDITRLDISYNELTGTLPESIGQLTNIEIFDVRYNDLNGTIPESIGQWIAIKDATFYINNFIGTMPTGICNYITTNEILVTDCNFTCSCCTSFYCENDY